GALAVAHSPLVREDLDPCHVPLVVAEARRALAAAVVFFLVPRPPRSTPFPYTTLFRSFSTTCRSTTGSMAARASAGACTRSCRRSEEHTSELQSRENLVCRLLPAKKESPRIRSNRWRSH